MYIETGHVTPTPPFDFAKSLHFLRYFAPMQREQTLSAHNLTKAIYIEGIGTWSAQFILLRGLGRTEHIPLTEKKLLEAASRTYGRGQEITPEDLQRIADKYGLWQGYWAHYLRVAS